jgi:hypothetical protein
MKAAQHHRGAKEGKIGSTVLSVVRHRRLAAKKIEPFGKRQPRPKYLQSMRTTDPTSVVLAEWGRRSKKQQQPHVKGSKKKCRV